MSCENCKNWDCKTPYVEETPYIVNGSRMGRCEYMEDQVTFIGHAEDPVAKVYMEYMMTPSEFSCKYFEIAIRPMSAKQLDKITQRLYALSEKCFHDSKDTCKETKKSFNGLIKEIGELKTIIKGFDNRY